MNHKVAVVFAVFIGVVGCDTSSYSPKSGPDDASVVDDTELADTGCGQVCEEPAAEPDTTIPLEDTGAAEESAEDIGSPDGDVSEDTDEPDTDAPDEDTGPPGPCADVSCEAGFACKTLRGSPRCYEVCDLTAPNPDAPCQDEGSRWPRIVTDDGQVLHHGGTCVGTSAPFDSFETPEQGVCVEGCSPFVPEEENGCTRDGLRTCLPATETGQGACFASGDTPLGGACEDLGDVGGLGQCQGDAHCVFEDTGRDTPGVCGKLCRPFTSDGWPWPHPEECDSDEVCSLYSLHWGVCTSNVTEPREEPWGCDGFPCLPCEVGEYCDQNVICIMPNMDGQTECVAFCRADRESDCPEGSSCVPDAFAPRLGGCVPDGFPP